MSTKTQETPVLRPETIQETLLSRPAAAEYLGLATNTLSVWASAGRYDLPFLKVGRRVLYRQSDLDRWLEARVQTSTR